MQVTIGTWRMREQCVPGYLSSSPAQEPGNEAMVLDKFTCQKSLQTINYSSMGEMYCKKKITANIFS